MLDKRSISEVESPDVYDDDFKKSSKPGRKPLKSEPKNKRTAQNRAAQRAFRERKERKMKELEEKVDILENEKIKVSTESEFLRTQVSMLMNELSRYRNTSDLSFDLPEPAKTTPISTSSTSTNLKEKDSPESLNSVNSLDTGATSASSSSDANFTFEFPWSKSNLMNLSNSNISHLSSGVSHKSSIPSLSKSSISSNSPIEESGLKNEELFDEKVDSFCMNLNEACGTRQNPVPKFKGVKDPLNFASPAVSSINDLNREDPLSFLNDGFDSSLAFNSLSSEMTNDNFTNNLNNFNDDNNNTLNLFADNFDPITLLTTEESTYDPLSSLFDQSITVPSLNKNEAESSDDEDEMVPKDDQLMKCSEVWDRIASHPRYDEIDIDGLCMELKKKAKCSEAGVVINSKELSTLLERVAE